MRRPMRRVIPPPTDERSALGPERGITADITRIEEGFATVLPTDRVCRVRSALDKLGQLTSAITDNDVLNTILGIFCIGK